MPESSPTIWGVHAGRSGIGDSLFLQHGTMALGWKEMGDLSAIPADREGFKTKLAATYPNKKAGAIPNNAGQLFRFLYEMKEGDLVIYPSKADRQVHIGRVTGSYKYSPEPLADLPQHRDIEWLEAIPRTQFSQGALYEIGSAMTLFQVKTYAEEFLAALEGEPSTPVQVEDDTVAAVAAEIEENTRDFVLKQLAKELKGHPLEEFIAHLLGTMGYRTRVTQMSSDGGVDVVAHRDELGFEPPIIKVQVKSTQGTVGDPEVSALYGKVGPGEFGLMVTLGTFSQPAKHFGAGKTNLRMIDGNELVDIVLQHYEEFDSRYKGLLPLKRVYVPNPLDGGD